MRGCANAASRRLAWVVAGFALLLGGCASPGALVLHNVGSADAARPGSYVNATPEQARQGLRVSRDGQPLAVDVGMVLATGDLVECLADTVAVLRFPDGHEATLLPRTRVRLGSIFVFSGEAFVRVFKQAQDKLNQAQGQFKVRTRYVTAGVEGTTFWVRLDPDDHLAVGVLEGRISLSSADGRWQPVPVVENEVATVLRDGPPSKLPQERDQVDSIVRLMRSGMGLTPRPPPMVRLPMAPGR